MTGKLPRALKASYMCISCRSRLLPQSTRSLSTTASSHAYSPEPSSDGMDAFNRALRSTSQARRPPQQNEHSASLFRAVQGKPSDALRNIAATASYEARNKPSALAANDEPYHVNVFAHKHNTHITFTDPNRNPILSLSAGDIGMKKAARGTYESSYQLAVFAFGKMMEKQWRMGGKKSKTMTRTMRDVDRIEVLLRGYGPGREAFQKAILGVEGRLIKHKVTKVTDGTRLKFGGCRSRAVRRL